MNRRTALKLLADDRPIKVVTCSDHPDYDTAEKPAAPCVPCWTAYWAERPVVNAIVRYNLGSFTEPLA